MIRLSAQHHYAFWYLLRPSAYDEAASKELRAIPGVAWDKQRKAYWCPSEALEIVAQCSSVRLSTPHHTKVIDTDYLHITRCQLRDYQDTGIEWCANKLRTSGGALLADEMGIGKTVQALCAVELLKPQGPVVIICPAVVRAHWKAQIKQWGVEQFDFRIFGYEEFLASLKPKKPQCPDSPTQRHTGSPKLRKNGKALKSHVCDHCSKTFMPEPIAPKPPSAPAIVILDEVHYCSNPHSQRSEAISGYLKQQAQRPLVLALSGTPMTARPKDLWHPLTLLHPGRWGSKGNFEARYCDGKFVEIPNVMQAVWEAKGASNLEELQGRLQAVMLRRTKKDVALELPARARVTIPVDLPPAAAGALEAAAALIDWNSQLSRRGGVGSLLSQTEEYKVSAAVQQAQEIIANGGRPLILTTRKVTAEQISEALACVVVDGDTKPDLRESLLRDSCVAASCGVATMQSVTTGINLTCYDAIVMVGLDWLPSTLRQAEDRIHRIGQDSPVTIYYLIGTGTLDEVVRERVIARLEVLGAVVGDGDADMIRELSGGSEEDLINAIADGWLKGKAA